MSVSRVINGTRKVSSESERKVRAALERIGYEPNEAARVLKGQRSRVLGIVVPDLADPFFATCANSIQEAARVAGYVTWMAATAHSEGVEREVTEAMVQRHVAGLLVVPNGSHNRHFARAAQGGIPIVSIDRPLENVKADAVVVDNREATARATKHLIEHGHRSILCVTDDYAISTRMERIAGYSEAMKQAKLSAQVCAVGPVGGSLSVQLNFALNTSTPATAIFAESNLIAVQILHELQNRCLPIPNKIALIAFDDFDAATLIRPTVTVIRQPIAELGRQATDLLLSRLNKTGPSRSARIVIPTEFVLRESCGCGKRSAKSRATSAMP